MVSTLRTPPRFVPTLTAVVELPVPPEPPAETPEAVAETETLVSQAAFHSPEEEKAAMAPALALSDAEAFRFEEGLVHRVLQRVDLSLEARMTDTVSAAVQQQLDSMLPRLRAEIETILRELVVEALAHELSENTGSATGLGPESLG
ncbi:hypothetical protein ACSFA8_14175 [Variovorax sp. RT4R15]|uniref:hypothetical protein n=1 Tax=Variovorax sp. RT4R15 TaxID=3443737 RepID=UPI003F45AAC5